ncbi:hypothetical protein RclHR1_06080003 [Rhizophagus clarus]|uniref:Uncharacterized protein n=1 Tax=Rhizophagus clarus TaxID=94130 RepID=A0A2Z6RR85_9GLOM|nr:hypothetical protein RclHR1_06080003 [Rhizophagus clarus]GES76224.1 hypothetical protein RCL_e22401_RclHR1_06080003 [Rhizophagus clarus]
MQLANSGSSGLLEKPKTTGDGYTWDPKPPSGFPKVSGFGIYESKQFPKPEINSETRNCFGPNYARLGQHYL